MYQLMIYIYKRDNEIFLTNLLSCFPYWIVKVCQFTIRLMLIPYTNIAYDFAAGTLPQKRSKIVGMRFYWPQDREAQKYSHVYLVQTHPTLATTTPSTIHFPTTN